MDFDEKWPTDGFRRPTDFVGRDSVQKIRGSAKAIRGLTLLRVFRFPLGFQKSLGVAFFIRGCD